MAADRAGAAPGETDTPRGAGPGTDQTPEQLAPISGRWIGLYVFASFWMLMLFSLDASHFGPGFFPLLASLLVVPVLSLVILFDLSARCVDAFQGKGSSWARRLWPIALAAIATADYGFVWIALWGGWASPPAA
jgi:hypothetical protein